MIITQYLLSDKFCGSHDHYIVSIELQFVVLATPQQPPQPQPQSPPCHCQHQHYHRQLHLLRKVLREVGAKGAGAEKYKFCRDQYEIYMEHYILRELRMTVL